MLPILAGLLFACVSYGQYLISPAQTPAAAKLFESQPGDRLLHCQVTPMPAHLNYGFRFQAGYAVALQMSQYVGSGHRLGVITRVTPEGKDPVFLAAPMKLPNVPKTKGTMDFGGSYLLGEGHYKVDWLLYDDGNRVCRKSWKVDVKLNSAERGLKLGIGPATVAPISFRRWSGQSDEDVRPLRRLTVWLHAAPMFARSTRFRSQDRGLLLGSLASVLESLPAKSVRIVVFNLDQQRELFRQDDLTPDAFDQVAQSLNNIELGLVDYKILQNRRGHVDLLADLFKEEFQTEDPSDAVVLLGPGARYFDKLPAEALDQSLNSPRFFYFQLKPYFARAEVDDTLANAIGKAKGKTRVIRTADDFAKAIKQVRTQVAR